MKKNYYQKRKAEVRDEAIEWQTSNGNILSWWDISNMVEHFETLGRRYGLLREFRENCVI